MTFTLTFCITTQSNSQGYSSSYSSGITYQQFYDDLSPYGNWVNYEDYGYVWVPYEAGFRPYYNNGHWAYTNYGWTWVSGYNWGWAPFHYGRWLYNDDYGWMWMPGYEWAPAWVSWRSGGDYYGWAPLGPGVNFNTADSRIPYNYWAFVPHRYINSPRINNYYVNREKNVTIINSTTIINNVRTTNNKNVYVTGPLATDVERNTNEKIRPVRLIERHTPGNTKVLDNAISIYKPPVKETGQQTATIKPPKVTNLNELKAQHAHTENRQAQNDQRQSPPVTQQMPAREIITNQPSVNQQKKLPENKITENQKVNPVQQKPIEEVTPQKNIPEKVIQPRQEIKIQKNIPSVNQSQNIQEQNNNKPIIRNNQPVNVQENKQAVRTQQNIQPVERTFNNSHPTPVNRQPARVQQNNNPPQNNRQPVQNYQRVNRQPVVREAPVMRNQNPVPQQQIQQERLLQKQRKD